MNCKINGLPFTRCVRGQPVNTHFRKTQHMATITIINSVISIIVMSWTLFIYPLSFIIDSLQYIPASVFRHSERVEKSIVKACTNIIDAIFSDAAYFRSSEIFLLSPFGLRKNLSDIRFLSVQIVFMCEHVRLPETIISNQEQKLYPLHDDDDSDVDVVDWRRFDIIML